MRKKRRFHPGALLFLSGIFLVIFAAGASARGASHARGASASAGLALVKGRGCLLCHTTNGKPLVGPSWKGIYGTKVTVMVNSRPEVKTVDEKYLRFMITNPNVWVVKGYKPIMTVTPLAPEQVDDIIAYIKTLK